MLKSMELMTIKPLHLICAITLLFAVDVKAQQSTETTTNYFGDRGEVELVSKFKGPDIKSYMLDLILRVRAQRAFSGARNTPLHQPGKLVVEFVIHRDGNLEYVKVSKTSGDQSIDQQLIDAIQAAAPFHQLSPEFKDKPLKLRWHMEFKRTELSSSSP